MSPISSVGLTFSLVICSEYSEYQYVTRKMRVPDGSRNHDTSVRLSRLHTFCILLESVMPNCIVWTVRRSASTGIRKYSRISRTSKGNKNWFEKSGFREIEGASNVAKLLRYCFIRNKHAHFRSNRWEMADLLLAL